MLLRVSSFQSATAGDYAQHARQDVVQQQPFGYQSQQHQSFESSTDQLQVQHTPSIFQAEQSRPFFEAQSSIVCNQPAMNQTGANLVADAKPDFQYETREPGAHRRSVSSPIEIPYDQNFVQVPLQHSQSVLLRSSAAQHQPEVIPRNVSLPSLHGSSEKVRGTQQDEGLLRPHTVACFGFGGRLAIVFAGSNALSNVGARFGQAKLHMYGLKSLLCHTAEVQCLNTFPGPLSIKSPKKAVLESISLRLTSKRLAREQQLLWSYLKILCERAGAQDAANLTSVLQLLELFDETPQKDQQDGMFSEYASPLLTTESIDSCLIRGNVVEAHKLALRGSHWSHALALAYLISPETYQDTLLQYIDMCYPEGHPLRTLFAICCGRSKEVFQNISKNSPLLLKWKENLRMLLANNHRRDNAYLQQAIGQLGDSLWAHLGDVASAHFCYLLAGQLLKPFVNKSARIVLIGADHKTQPSSFITIDSIQLSEIFEYVNLCKSDFSPTPSLQVYRYVYACWLAEWGFMNEAFKYYRAVSSTIKSLDHAFPQLFIQHLQNFGLRLSYHLRRDASGVTADGSLLSKVGGLFNRVLNAAIGDDDVAQAPPNPELLPNKPRVGGSETQPPGAQLPKQTSSHSSPHFGPLLSSDVTKRNAASGDSVPLHFQASRPPGVPLQPSLLTTSNSSMTLPGSERSLSGSSVQGATYQQPPSFPPVPQLTAQSGVTEKPYPVSEDQCHTSPTEEEDLFSSIANKPKPTKSEGAKESSADEKSVERQQTPTKGQSSGVSLSFSIAANTD